MGKLQEAAEEEAALLGCEESPIKEQGICIPSASNREQKPFPKAKTWWAFRGRIPASSLRKLVASLFYFLFDPSIFRI